MIDLEVLFASLDALLPCRKACERAVSEGELRVRYRIRDLSLGTPRVELEPVPTRGDPGRSVEAIKLFRHTLAELRKPAELQGNSGSRLGQFRPDELKHFRKLAVLTAKTLERIEVDSISITTETLANLDRLCEKDHVTYGSVRGVLKAISIHKGFCFRIYPPHGNSVECVFSEDELQAVGKSLGKNVTVSGRLVYKTGVVNPQRVYVETIVEHPPDEELPRLSQLRGVLVDAIGDGRSEDVLRELRDDE